jgi:hypothetical protein
MKIIKIFCEGINDQLFVAACLETFYSEPLKKTSAKKDKLDIKSDTIEIIDIGGREHLNTDLYLNMMISNTKKDGINLVIFDADEPCHGKGNIANTKKSLDDLQSKATFQYYILPNDLDNGTVENLLIQLIPKDKKGVFDCFDSYNNCIKKYGMTTDETLKRALNSYAYNFNHAKKESERDYTDKKFWCLDYNIIPDLTKFKHFLDMFFKAQPQPNKPVP